MYLKTHRILLRTRQSLYIKVLVFISMLSVPAFLGCGWQDKAKEQKRIDDSIANAKLLQLEREKTRQDSLARVEKEKVRVDSVLKAKADSTLKAEQNNFKPVYQTTKYGIPRNNYKPQEEPKKYGVPVNYRD